MSSRTCSVKCRRSRFSDDPFRVRSALAILSLLVALAPGVAVSQTNFVVVISDDQRWDTEFAMTNVLNRIAGQGVRFTNTFTTSPICGPTRATFHAGGFAPDESGILANTFPNGGVAQFNDAQTVGTAFYQAGYKTLHLGKYINGYPQDLEPYIPPGWTRWVHSTTLGSSTMTSGVGTTVSLNGVPRLEYYRDQALEFIDEFQTSPFFIVLETERPHWPAIPLAQEVGLYPDFLYRERAWLESDLSDKPPIIQAKARDYPDWYEGSIAEEDEFHRDQLRSVHGIDRIIGNILDKLEERNLLDNTVVVFVSDNGYLWGEHRQFGKGMAYEESLRVPMAMRVPGVAPREDSRLVAWDMDLPATLFELAGIAAPTDGTSLAPALSDPLIPGRTELPSEFWDNQLTWAALRTIEPGGAQWKYVEWGTGEHELYDLINDPYEMQSLHDDPAYAAILLDLEARRALHPRSLAIAMNGRFIPRGDIGVAYSHDFNVWGGTPPYVWDSFGSTLPPGLSLDPNTGRISGIPILGGEFEFDVAVYDSGTYSHAGGPRRFVKSLRLNIHPILATPLPSISSWGLVALALLLVSVPSLRFVAKSRARPMLLGVALLLVSGRSTDLEAAEFIPLGDLPGSSFVSKAFAVSADGTTVVGHSDSATGMQAFRWTQGTGMVGLGALPGGSYSSARGVSADGQVVVGSSISGTRLLAFRWTAAGGLGELPNSPPGITSSQANGVSSDGSVVVGWRKISVFDFEAFRWTEAAGMEDLGTLGVPGYSSQAAGVSFGGSTIAGHSGEARPESLAVRWAADNSILSLGDLPGSNLFSQAFAISGDGSVIVGRGNATAGTEAFRWTQATGLVGLGFLPGGTNGSIALATSADGSVVAGVEDAASAPMAFHWNETDGMQSLQATLIAQGIDLTGWSLAEANGVSADGLVIVGSGENPNGNTEAFRAVLDAPN